MQKMDIDYFINKFSQVKDMSLTSATPCNDVWANVTEEEADVLYKIAKPFGILLEVNDGLDGADCFGDTPHMRVVNFLKWVKSERSPYLNYEK